MAALRLDVDGRARLSHAFGAVPRTVEFLRTPLVGDLKDDSHRATIFASIREPRASNRSIRPARESKPGELHGATKPRPIRSVLTHVARLTFSTPRNAQCKDI